MYTVNEIRIMNGFAPIPAFTFEGDSTIGMYQVGLHTRSSEEALLYDWEHLDSTIQAVDGMYDRRYSELVVYEILEKARIHFKMDFDIERELKVSILNFENRANRSVKIEATSEIGNTFIDQLNDLETQIELMDWHK